MCAGNFISCKQDIIALHVLGPYRSIPKVYICCLVIISFLKNDLSSPIGMVSEIMWNLYCSFGFGLVLTFHTVGNVRFFVWLSCVYWLAIPL